MPQVALDSTSKSAPTVQRRLVPSWAGWLVAAMTFAAVAPTLRWYEFSNGIEQLYTATILELGRGGPWLVPQLIGAPRIAKPPLPAWIGGLSLSPETMQGVASASPGVREQAFLQLGWEIRWPALLAGCLMLVATFDLGKSVGGRRAALGAVVIAATSLLFLRFARLATADVYLACFVAIANALLARAALRNQRWIGYAGAGVAIGFACMCKGPVGLLQTLVPLAVWAWWVGRNRVASASTLSNRKSSSRNWLPAIFGIVFFLAVALPWPVMVLKNMPGAPALWWREVTREGATNHEYGPFWSYLSLLPNLVPWLPAFLLGVAFLGRKGPKNGADRQTFWAKFRFRLSGVGRHQGYLLAWLLLLVPVLVMSLFRDKPERYLVPMLPAAAVLGGRGLVALAAGVRRSRKDAGWIASIQLGFVAVILIGCPLAGMIPKLLKRADGHAWYAPSLGVPAMLFAITLTVAMFWLLVRRRPGTAFALAFIGMLLVNALMIWGYKDDRNGRAEMRPTADQILARWPDPLVVYCDNEKPIPPDLMIYLNRVVHTWKLEAAKGDVPAPRKPNRTPDVYVMLQREKSKEPELPGWRSFAKAPYKARFWHTMEKVTPDVPR